MKTIEQEAKRELKFWWNTFCTNMDNGRFDLNQVSRQDILDAYTDGFIEGANSKWVQAQIINAKIDGLLLANDNGSGIMYRIQELEEQLKQLEDEN